MWNVLSSGIVNDIRHRGLGDSSALRDVLHCDTWASRRCLSCHEDPSNGDYLYVSVIRISIITELGQMSIQIVYSSSGSYPTGPVGAQPTGFPGATFSEMGAW